MTASEARVVWATLAMLAGLASFAGLILSTRALIICWRRMGVGPIAARAVVRRDTAMFAALTLACASSEATAILLLFLVHSYSHELDGILAELAVPVSLAYAGYVATIVTVTTITPIWLLTRWRALDRLSRRNRYHWRG